MAIKWSQVSQKPEFLALSPEEQEETRQLYFDEVLSPQVDPADLEEARSVFDEDTAPTQPSGSRGFELDPMAAIPGFGPVAAISGALGLTGKTEMDKEAPDWNTLRGIGERAKDLSAGALRAVKVAGDYLEEKLPLGYVTEEGYSPDAPDYNILTSAAQALDTVDLGYEEQTTWEDVKQNPLKVPAYAFEKGTLSLVDAAAALAVPPVYLTARAGEIADDRAANLGLDEPTPDQLKAAIPAAIFETVAERFGGRGMLGLTGDAATAAGRVLGAAGKEAGTEALQEAAEYTATTAGTGLWNPYDMLDQALAGAVAGGPTGGTIRGVTEVVTRTPADVQAESDQAKFDLAEDLHENVLPDPKRILQQSQNATIQEREASIKTEGTAQVDALEAELEEPAPTPIQTEVEVEEIEAAPAPPVSYEEMRAMTVDEAMDTLTEGHDVGTLRMTPDEFNSLVEDIKERGIREPITLESGIRPGQLTLTDGRHRLLAAKAAGLKAVPVQVDPQEAPAETVPEVTLEPEAVESPVTTQPVEAVPTHSEQEIARGKPERGRLSAKYKELGGRKDKDTGGYVFRSVDKKRVERADLIFGESNVEAVPGVARSFQTYIKDRGLSNIKLDRTEMKAVRSDYRTSLASQRPQVQAGPSDLTTRDSSLDRLRYVFQDKFLDLKRIEEVAGPGRAKPYRAEELYHGRAAARVDDIKTNYVDPVTSILADHKLELQDLNDYMQAVHAPEANAELERRNPERENNKALSGMSNEQAAEIRAKWEGNEGMQQAAQYIKDLNEVTADIVEMEGLEPGDVVQQWRDTYKNYVPLHREGKASTAGKGKGFSIRGRESKGRVGSEDRVVDVVGHSVQNHARIIQRAEKNRVGLEVLNFARENPDTNFWKINPVETTVRMNPETGLVETVSDPTYQTKPNVFEVKEDGKTHHIVFNESNPTAVRLGNSLNNLDADQGGKILGFFRFVNRYLSAMSTTYNPEFVFSNFFRDLQTAGIKLEATEAKGLQLDIARDLFPSMKAIWHGERGGKDTKLSKYHEEWRQAGGKTGWIDARADVESRVKDLESLIKSKQKGGAAKRADSVYRWTKGFMEDVNSAVENGVRLSTYINARRRGVPVEDAASLSKNLTVNFNRKGSAGPAMNAAYLFYNAGVQGSTNVLGSLRSKRVQKLVAGITVGAVANAFLQRAIGGEDEDGVPYWDKIGSWEKERNLIIMNPTSDEGDYFKIPLPYGYNIFKVFGESAADAIARDDYSALDAAASIANAAVGSFNPVGSDASFLQTLAPTLADPFVQVAENKTFYGAPLRPENRYGADKADSELYFRSAREWSVATARALNRLTGGSAYRSGVADVSPETLDLTLDFLVGGAGRTAADAGGTLMDILTGDVDERPVRRVPGLRRFYGAEPDTWTPQTYFEYKQDVTAFEAEAKAAAKGGEDLARFRQDPRAKLVKSLKSVEKGLRVAYKGRDKIEAAQPEGWEDRVKSVEERIEWARKRFIMQYREVMFPKD